MVMMDDPFDLLRPMTVTVRVSAKVNLALGVGGLAPDGFHPLATVFEAICIYDEVAVTRRDDSRITLTVSGEDADQVPTNETNLAWRAVELVREEFASEWGKRGHGADIHIDKSIPVAGGMAGGSADAAGALMAAAALCRLPYSPEELQPLAAQLGSDVPFCLTGGVALGRGRGDRLAPVICRGRHRWVFATSNQGLSTPAVYRRFDELGGTPGGETVPNDLISALTRGDLDAVAASLSNDLQAAAIDLRPELEEVLTVGREVGALTALVSGSGPTCAFLVRDTAGAKKVSAAVSNLPQVHRTRTARGPAAGAQLLPGPVGSFA
ncbi:4-(cytidine 5'-diphospho)-2-C-methyl-D-erythritol kinase [Cutibacterium acnes]|uniref:4-(cytidine 5'-diphospho)-2-C-methyl-D-erythritol kinase n=1 Tax=Cutibacterium acnes TaxID=1747 RepID=UPI001F189DD0|nr:4-(cytidine 5'-diphospho)-2-C-methyl-D-erythritol kinase [Cutibacterium acnes]